MPTARRAARSNFRKNQRHFMSCRRCNGRLDDKERNAQKLGAGLGFASVRKSTAVMRDFTHHRGGVFAEGA